MTIKICVPGHKGDDAYRTFCPYTSDNACNIQCIHLINFNDPEREVHGCSLADTTHQLEALTARDNNSLGEHLELIARWVVIRLNL